MGDSKGPSCSEEVQDWAIGPMAPLKSPADIPWPCFYVDAWARVSRVLLGKLKGALEDSSGAAPFPADIPWPRFLRRKTHKPGSQQRKFKRIEFEKVTGWSDERVFQVVYRWVKEPGHMCPICGHCSQDPSVVNPSLQRILLQRGHRKASPERPYRPLEL